MTERSTSSWASNRIDTDPTDALKALEDGLTVRLIATPRSQLSTCAAAETLDSVVDRNSFDFFQLQTSKMKKPKSRLGL